MKRIITIFLFGMLTLAINARVTYEHTFSLQEQRELGISDTTNYVDAIRTLEATNSEYLRNSDSENWQICSITHGEDKSITIKQNLLSLEMLDTTSANFTAAHMMLLVNLDEFVHKHERNKVCMTLTHNVERDEHGCATKESWSLYDEFLPPSWVQGLSRQYELKITLERNWTNMQVLKSDIANKDSVIRDGKIYMKGDTIRRYIAPHPQFRLPEHWQYVHKGQNRITVKCFFDREVIDEEVIYDDGLFLFTKIVEKRLHKFVNKINWEDVDKICPMRSCSRFKQDYKHKADAISFSNWKPYWNAFYPGRGVYINKFSHEDSWFIQVFKNCSYYRGPIHCSDLVKMGFLKPECQWHLLDIIKAQDEYHKLPYEECQERRRQAGLKTY